jgi:hypothetical protein
MTDRTYWPGGSPVTRFNCIFVTCLLATLCFAVHGQNLEFSIKPPSPQPWSAADIVRSDGFGVRFPPAALGLLTSDDVDSFSYGDDEIEPLGPYNFSRIAYSVAAGAQGNGSLITAQAQGNGAAGDKFQVSFVGYQGRFFPVTTPQILSDAPRHQLSPAPMETELDGLSLRKPAAADFPVYFCVRPGHGFGAADILMVVSNGAAPQLFASAAQLGLVPGDDIDALAIGTIPVGGPRPLSLGSGVVIWVSLRAGSPTRGAVGLAGSDGIIQVYPGSPTVVVDAPILGLAPGDELDAITGLDPGFGLLSGVLPSIVNVGGNKVGRVTDNSGGSYSMVGGGFDIWDQRDEFTFAFSEWRGDFDVQVRVESLVGFQHSKAGIMVRESLGEFSRMVYLRVTPPTGANNTKTGSRTGLDAVNGVNGGQNEVPASQNPPPFPNAWLRLVRAGNVLTSSVGTNGSNWTVLSTVNTAGWGGGPLASKVHVGLAACGNGGGETAKAEFRDFRCNFPGAFRVVGADSLGNPNGAQIFFNQPFGFNALNPANYSFLRPTGTVAGGLRLTTANDAPERDPTTYMLEGTTNSPRTGPWTLIASNNTSLPTTRGSTVNLTFINSTPYTSYRLLFPTVRDAAAANGMQIAEVELLGTGGNELTQPGDLIGATSGTSPGGESVNNAIDNNTATKYLNFDKLNTGFVVTPSSPVGPLTLTSPVVLAVPGQPAVQINFTETLTEGLPYRITVANVTSASGGTLATTTATFVHGAGFEEKRIHITHNKTDNSGYYRFSDAVAKGIGDNIMTGQGTFPGQQSNNLFEDSIPDTNNNERYSSRLTGVFIPPTTGDYVFWMASDDVGDLYLSSDDNPANKVGIAREPSWSGRREYFAGANQSTRGVPPANISVQQHLQAGGKYYLELVYSEGGGGNHGSATVQLPGGAAVVNGSSPIPDSAFKLSRMMGGEVFENIGPVRITQDPADIVVPELSFPNFRVRADGAPSDGGYSYQWQCKGTTDAEFVDIPGANQQTWTVVGAVGSDNGKQFRCIVANSFSSAPSAAATLTVTIDMTPPTLVSARNVAGGDTQFDLVFSEPVTKADAEDLANYSMSGGVTLANAVLQADGKTVRFTCSSLAEFTIKTLTVNNVRDASTLPNPIAANSQVDLVYSTQDVRYYRFDGIPGTALSDLYNDPDFPNNPSAVGTLDSMEYAPNLDFYGARLTAFLSPPVSGNYTFYVSADDNAELYLSTDHYPANKVRIAREPAWSGIREWTGPGAGDGRNCSTPGSGNCNISLPIPLTGGKRYYIELIFKEHSGGDHGAVAWQTPENGPQPNVPVNGSEPIPKEYLSKLNLPPTIVDQPSNTTAVEGRSATFRVEVQGTPPHLYQWYRGAVPIPGATGPSYTINSVTMGDNNATFSVNVSQANPFGQIMSDLAKLIVFKDTAAPEITRVVALSKHQLLLTFDEPLDPLSAGVRGNYVVSGLTVIGATLLASGNQVQLELAGSLTLRSWFELTVNGLTDNFGNAATDQRFCFRPEANTAYRDRVRASVPVLWFDFDQPILSIVPNRGSLADVGDGLFMSGIDPANSLPASLAAEPGPRPGDGFFGFFGDNYSAPFDGDVSDYWMATHESAANNLDEFTINTWILPSADRSPGGSAIAGQPGVIELGFGGFDFLYLGTGNGGLVTAPFTDISGAWTQLTAVGDGQSLKIYLNGTEVGSGGFPTANYGSSSRNFQIGGGDILYPGDSFTGGIEDVTFFNRALQPDEIFGFYQAAQDGSSAATAPPTIDAPAETLHGVAGRPFTFEVAFGDVDTPLDQIKGTVVSEDVVLIPNENISITGSGRVRQVTVTPAANQTGPGALRIHAYDGENHTSTTVLVTIDAGNRPPIGQAQNVITAEDTLLPLILTGNDPDGDTYTFTIADPPSHGSLSGTPPFLFYTPGPNFNGSDGFKFKLNDGSVDSADAKVSIEVTPVNDPPVAKNDRFQAVQNQMLAGSLFSNNGNGQDVDVDGDIFTAGLGAPPGQGQLTLNPDGTFTYLPNPNFVGNDFFTYSLNDGHGGTANGDVTIRIDSVIPDVVDFTSFTVADGKLELTWPEGMQLQCADQVHGPWLYLDAVRTYSTEMVGPQRFYRLVRPKLGFVLQYEHITLGQFDDGNGEHTGPYESPIIPFFSVPGAGLGIRLGGIHVTPDAMGDLTSDSPPPPPPALDGFQINAEVVNQDSSTSQIQLDLDDGGYHGATLDVPDTAQGIRIIVVPPDNTVKYYSFTFTDVTLPTQEVLDAQRDMVIDVPEAHDSLTEAGGAFASGLGLAKKAEELLRLAYANLDRGPVARKLLADAQSEFEKALQAIEQTKEALRRALDALPETELFANQRMHLTRIIKHFCALTTVVTAHFWIYERTFTDLPKIKFNVDVDQDLPPDKKGSWYDKRAMKLQLAEGAETFPPEIAHEYGHAILHAKTKWDLPGREHYPADHTDNEVAWSEGVATFFGQAILGEPDYSASNRLIQDLEANTVQGKDVTNHGTDVEANVQSALWDILDGENSGVPDDDGDGLSLPFALIWTCICEKPTTLEEFIRCLKGRLDDETDAALDAVLRLNNIP